MSYAFVHSQKCSKANSVADYIDGSLEMAYADPDMYRHDYISSCGLLVLLKFLLKELIMG